MFSAMCLASLSFRSAVIKPVAYFSEAGFCCHREVGSVGYWRQQLALGHLLVAPLGLATRSGQQEVQVVTSKK